MALALPKLQRFSFSSRPIPVPGDLRINWRISLTVLMLGQSRSHRASLAKLHVLNYATRSAVARDQIIRILDGKEPTLNWHMRVEPAFGRALNFVTGEKIADWVRTAQRSGLQLTKRGLETLKSIEESGDVLSDEREFLSTIAKRITEEFVSRLLHARRI